MFAKETLTGDALETLASEFRCKAPYACRAAYSPHPSFWAAILWRRSMGARVLAARFVPPPGGMASAGLRAYVHCAPPLPAQGPRSRANSSSWIGVPPGVGQRRCSGHARAAAPRASPNARARIGVCCSCSVVASTLKSRAALSLL